MGHVTRDTGRAMIDIDTITGQILLAQKWAYRWHKEAGQQDWTQAEKHDFHRRSDMAVWAVQPRDIFRYRTFSFCQKVRQATPTD